MTYENSGRKKHAKNGIFKIEGGEKRENAVMGGEIRG
jgi:hypothetical protein